jgi:Flp pilus assembly protein TadD
MPITYQSLGNVMSQLNALSAAGLLSIMLAGCAFPGDPGVSTTLTVQEPLDPKYYPSDEPYRLAVEQFNRGHYGLAERYFRDAVEKAPEDVASWIGLAASYDRTRRFDLADRAYQNAIRLGGETIQILNNEGYSYMLRGDLVNARKKFMKACEIDPNNPTIVNNLILLDGSARYIQRGP